MSFRIEFFRVRNEDGAHAMLGRVPYAGPDLAGAKRHAKFLFYQMNMPQSPDGLRIVNAVGVEVFAWTRRDA